MTVTGVGKVIRIKENDNDVLGVLAFVSEKTKLVDKIGFSIKNTPKGLQSLRNVIESNELIEITGKLYKNSKQFYISVIDLKVCQKKYKLLNEVESSTIEV